MNAMKKTLLERPPTIPSVDEDPTLQREAGRLRELRAALGSTQTTIGRLRTEIDAFQAERHADSVSALLGESAGTASPTSERVTLRASLDDETTRIGDLTAAITIQMERVAEIRQRVRGERLPLVKARRNEVARAMREHLEDLGRLNADLTGLINEWGSTTCGHSLPSEWLSMLARIVEAV
jgi:chromosome segregation ATPase